MNRFAKTFALAALALTGMAGAASAQGNPSFCNGVLKANSFYRNILSTGTTSEAVYKGQFQNQDPQNRSMTATVTRISTIRIGNVDFRVLRIIDRIELTGYQQKEVELLSLEVKNPSGQGAPEAGQVGSQIRVFCNFH